MAARFLESELEDRHAKGKGVSLLPEFDDALEAVIGDNYEPIKAFIVKVKNLIAPDGRTMVEWVWGLGTAKRNALSKLYREMSSFNPVARSAEPKGGPPITPEQLERWRDYLQRNNEKTIEGWRKTIKMLEVSSAASDESIEVRQGPFVVVPMPGVTRAQMTKSLKFLDDAVSKLQPVFPEVLYGKIYVSTHIKKNVAAWYLPHEDKFYINAEVTDSFYVHAIIHELGHRFDHKFLKTEHRNRYWRLSTERTYETIMFDAKLRGQVADEITAFVKAHVEGRPLTLLSSSATLWLKGPYIVKDIKAMTRDYAAKKVTEEDLRDTFKGTRDAEVGTGKILSEPLAVTTYGKKSPKENFAEGFAHFVLRKPLPPPLAAIFEEIKG